MASRKTLHLKQGLAISTQLQCYPYLDKKIGELQPCREMVHTSWHVSDRLCSNTGNTGGGGESIFHRHENGMPSDMMAFLLELKYF